MDRNVEKLLSGNVGFFEKFSIKTYSQDVVEKAFDIGRGISTEKLEVVILENDRLTEKVKQLKAVLEANKTESDNSALSIVNLIKDNDDLANKLSALATVKQKLELKINELSKEPVLDSKNQEIKDLEQKIKYQATNLRKEQQFDLKEATDGFLKTIKKYEKEIEQLKATIEKQKPKSDTVVKGQVIKHTAGKSSFTCEQVKEIRALAATGIFHTDIAKTYGVNRSTISKMVNNETYKDCK